jgi:hypothetical protein
MRGMSHDDSLATVFLSVGSAYRSTTKTIKATPAKIKIRIVKIFCKYAVSAASLL